MSNEDQKSLVMSRREVLALLGATGATLLAGYANAQSRSIRSTDGKLSTCVVTPKQTEGPYFVDEHLNRADIRIDPSDGSVKAGVPLTLGLRISSINRAGCTPLRGAIVDIWHCDAAGVYSDVTDQSSNAAGKKFLRGYQITNANGEVQFTTIYPGWYPGRTVHIHFKIRAKSRSGQHYAFASQLYFNDAITDRVYAHQPYASRGERTLKNDGDGIFNEGGRQLMLALAEKNQGYTGMFDVGLQMA